MKNNIQTLNFDPNGSRLFAKIKFEGLIVGSYMYQLWEAQSNDIIDARMGNNQNSEDDKYALPLPTGSNEGRLIDVRAKFVGLDPTNQPKFKIKVLLYQGGELIGEAFDANDKKRKLDGNGKTSQLYIFLKKKEQVKHKQDLKPK